MGAVDLSKVNGARRGLTPNPRFRRVSKTEALQNRSGITPILEIGHHTRTWEAGGIRSGLAASQAFFGVWPTNERLPLEALEAILNGPLTNAFLTERAYTQHFTNDLLKILPMPKGHSLLLVAEAVKRYRAARAAVEENVLQADDAGEALNRLLVEINAEVLRAYDLPPCLERRLLEFSAVMSVSAEWTILFGVGCQRTLPAYIPCTSIWDR